MLDTLASLIVPSSPVIERQPDSDAAPQWAFQWAMLTGAELPDVPNFAEWRPALPMRQDAIPSPDPRQRSASSGEASPCV